MPDACSTAYCLSHIDHRILAFQADLTHPFEEYANPRSFQVLTSTLWACQHITRNNKKKHTEIRSTRFLTNLDLGLSTIY